MTNKILIGLLAFLFAVSCVLGGFSFYLNSQINTLSDDQKAFKADTTNKFTAMQTDITNLDTDLNTFKTDTANKFTDVQNDITTLDSKFTAYKTETDNRLNTVESNVNDINTDLTDLAAQFAASTMNVRQVYDDVIGGVCYITGNIASGSGFVYSADGYIVTCWHVIDGQSYIDVIFHDGTTAKATVVGSDKYSDVAVIKVTGLSNLKPLTLADSGAAACGEPVMVIGNPLGIFESATYGIISRTKGMEYSSHGWWVSNLIQFDAPANPGNSGGPVFNSKGQVVGIVSMGYSYSDISFAIASNKIARMVQAIIDHGSFTNATLPGSWSLDNLTPEIVLQRGLHSSFGIIFLRATNMGQVQVNDIAIAVDGITIKDYADLFSYIGEFKKVGDTITLTLIRGSGTEIEASLTLVEGWVF